MKGWLYKEIRHYRIVLLFAVLLPFFCVWVPLMSEFLSSINIREHPLQYAFHQIANQTISSFLILVCFIMLFGLFLLLVVNGDEIKKWAYFVSSTPDGVKAFIYAKYLFVLMSCGLLFLSFFWNEALLITIAYMAYGVEIQSLSDITLILLFFILLLRAIDYPAMMRFGTHLGAKFKAFVFLGLILVGIIWLLFGPLPEDMESVTAGISRLVSNFLSGQYSEQTELVISLLPPAAMLAYYLSYKLSCRFYMKGAECYEK